MTIYGLFDPRTGELRYVGKSVRGIERARAHGRPSSLRREGDTYKTRWIQQLKSVGLDYEVCILEELDSLADIAEIEQWHIQYWRSLGCRLTNATKGGEGMAGWKPKEETKEKWRKALTGKPRSEEVKKKISEAQKGKPKSIETRRKMSLAKMGRTPNNKNKPVSQESKIKMSRSHGGRPIIDQDGTIYQTQNEAAKALGISQAQVWRVLNGNRKTTKGYTFRYLE